jgi:hypothetical protein
MTGNLAVWVRERWEATPVANEAGAGADLACKKPQIIVQ